MYSTKLDSKTRRPLPFSFPRQFQQLCLCCIDRICSTLSGDRLQDLWTKADCEDEFAAFYDGFWTTEEWEELVSPEQHLRSTETLSVVMEPLMHKLGMRRETECEKCLGLGGMVEGIHSCPSCVTEWREEKGEEGGIGVGKWKDIKRAKKAKSQGKTVGGRGGKA